MITMINDQGFSNKLLANIAAIATKNPGCMQTHDLIYPGCEW
jgi:hypothetical protein